MKEFVADVTDLREAARKHIENGAITDAYGADRDRVIEVLNSVLATELVCVLRYKRHHYMASGLKAIPVAAEFLAHASEEQDHADRVAHRIVQLGGAPDLNPDSLSRRSHSQYVEGEGLLDMVSEDLIAERIAVASYQEIARWLGEDDPTSRRLIESILEVEEEHAEELSSMLQEL